MNGLIRWFAGNSIAANLLMIGIMVAGGLALSQHVRRELFPAASLDVVRIAVPYPGATPVEAEEGIVLRIEEAVGDLPGVDKMTSTAREGMGSVTLEILDSFDVRDVLDDVKTRVDGITSFPEEAESPTIEAPVIRRRVIGLALSADMDLKHLRAVAERVRDQLLALPDITQVDISGTPSYEISIEVSEDTMRRYGLTFDEVRAAVRRASLDLPAGSIKREGGEILLRTKGQAFTGDDYAAIVLRSDAAGGLVRLGAVAAINDGFADEDVLSRYSGDPAVLIAISQVGDQDILTIAKGVKDYVAEARHHLPPGVRLAIWDDSSVAFQQRMETLSNNAVTGLILVFVSLTLFLRLRLAFWVTLGIPVSFLGALWVLPMADASFNMISMFAFILVLGIVVDDAIVVGEAIHTDQDAGNHGAKGALAGALRVSQPVLFAVATTMIAFAPMLFLSGLMGRFFRLIPIVVISCLFFSLVESLFILPAHLSHEPPLRQRAAWSPLRWMERVNDLVDAMLAGFIKRIYRPLLREALRWRYLTVSIFIAILLLGAGLIAGGFVRWIGFPHVAADYVTVSVTMPPGTTIERTDAVVAHIDQAIETLRAEYDGDHPDLPVIGDVVVTMGGALGGFGPMGGAGGGDAELRLDCPHLVEREVSVKDIMHRLETLVGDVPGVKAMSFASDLGGHGRAVNVRLSGNDLDELTAASQWLQGELHAIDGLYQIQDDFLGGKEEITLRITREAQTLGLRAEDLARQVRQAFYGSEVQRIQRGRDEIRVMIRYPEQQRRQLQSLEDMRIRTPSGAEVPFSRVASASRVIGTPTIRRRDRARMISVEAGVDRAVVDGETVNARIEEEFFPAIAEQFPGVTAAFGGRTEDDRQSSTELRFGMAGALFAMFALMAVAFRSYLQPLLIMSAIPFGIVGAVFGHLMLGMHLNMLSMFGIIALTGVVVNDSLVLIDAVNRLRAQGLSIARAVIEGSASRLRAVLLTTITTFIGLVPIMNETSPQARFLIPMPVSLAYGVLFATVITLVLIPVLYIILEDLRWLFLKPREDTGD